MKPARIADRTLFLLETTNPPLHSQNDLVVCWSSLTVTDSSISIPAIVERTSLELKREYLAWIHDLGNATIKGRSLKEFLFLEDPGLSAWWLSHLADMSPLNSTAIYKVFKLRTLERLYTDQGCGGLVYCGNDRRLHRTLKSWCLQLGHSYRWTPDKQATMPDGIPTVQRWARKLPHLIQATVYLTWKLCTRYVPTWLHGRHTPHAIDATDRAMIVTYFPNIDLEAARRGRFRSAYWGNLHDLIDEIPIAANWVWIHNDTKQCNFRQALSLRHKFNANRSQKDRHFLLEDFATPMVLIGAIRSYLRLYLRGLALKKVQRKFVLADSAINFYPFFIREWKSSLFGVAAIHGLIFRALFDSLTQRLPQQRWGLYVWENQPWESTLIAAWRHHQIGPIIGHQHVTMKPLEIRMICDERSYREKGRCQLPLPDILAINGHGALDLLRDVHYPEERIAIVEALRYPRLSRRDSPKEGGPRTLLVVGGYSESEAILLLRVLNEAADSIQEAGYARIQIKGHPFGPSRMLSLDLPFKLPYEIVSAPLDELWRDADFALIANASSAGVEALYAGIPFAVCQPDNDLNLSPLYGHPAVPFVSTGDELATALAAPLCAILPSDYFLLSEQTERWKDLLLRAAREAPFSTPAGQDGSTTLDKV